MLTSAESNTTPCVAQLLIPIGVSCRIAIGDHVHLSVRKIDIGAVAVITGNCFAFVYDLRLGNFFDKEGDGDGNNEEPHENQQVLKGFFPVGIDADRRLFTLFSHTNNYITKLFCHP